MNISVLILLSTLNVKLRYTRNFDFTVTIWRDASPLSPLSKIVRSTHPIRASADFNLALSAVARSRSGTTPFLIRVNSTPSKFIEGVVFD